MTGWRLLADIGGTNVRFARALGDGAIADPARYRLEAFADLEAAIHGYLKTIAVTQPCSEAAICAAGPVFDGAVQLTNAPWRISADEISGMVGGVPVMLVNDLQAVALALPHLGSGDVMPLGGGPRDRHGERMLAVNVGTGFGAALALRAEAGWMSSPSEAGHMRLPLAEDADDFLRPAGVLTVEDILSGEGLLKMHAAHRRRLDMELREPGVASAEDVWRMASSDDAAARRCVESFTRCLSGVARDLALAMAAWGGVFFCGGVVKGWARLADRTVFRRVFEAGGKMSRCLEQTPCGVIIREEVALTGLARMTARK